MSKLKKPQQRWVCQACGAVTTGWFGKCPTCDAWNSIEEEAPAPAPGERPSGAFTGIAKAFRDEGFVEVARRSKVRVILRREL